jgi:hypothetical protein
VRMTEGAPARQGRPVEQVGGGVGSLSGWLDDEVAGGKGAVTVSDVLEVLQLEEGKEKVRRGPIGRKRRRGTALTTGGRRGSDGSSTA